MLYHRLPDTTGWGERKLGLLAEGLGAGNVNWSHICVLMTWVSLPCVVLIIAPFMGKVQDTTVSGGACLCEMTLSVWRAKTTVHVHDLGVNTARGLSKSGWMWSFCPLGLGGTYVEEHRSRDLSLEKWQLAGLVRLVSPLSLRRKPSLACIRAVFVLGNGAQMSSGTQLYSNHSSSK